MSYNPASQMERSSQWRLVSYGLVTVAAFAVLVSTTSVSYLLYHSLVELFAILTGLLVGVVAWNTHQFSRNDFLIFIGLSYPWVAGIDLLHTLAYKGMGVFPYGTNQSANLSTQLWLAARLLEAGALIVAPRYLGRALPRVGVITAVMGGVAVLLTGAIFSGLFPTAYVEGEGLTSFKIAAEYVVVGMLVVAGGRLWQGRHHLDRNIVWLVAGAWALTILGELFFTKYIGVYDLSNLIGHLCKLASFWLIFVAVVRISLTEPFRLLSRDSTTYDAIPEEILVVDREAKVRQFNRVVRMRLGERAEEFIGEDCHPVFHPPSLAREECPVCLAIERGEAVSGAEFDMGDRWHLITLSPIGGPGSTRGMVHIALDITLRKQAEQQLQKANLDFLARLAMMRDEREAITAIEELFQVLMSPKQLHFVHFEDDEAHFEESLPTTLSSEIRALDGDWRWTESGKGFIVRIPFGEETLAAIAAEEFAFPAFRERYLNQALSVARICGLAIQNARSNRRMREAENALRRSERSLTLAQSIAHIGHWEWDVSSEEITWSEETYRILGYPPYTVKPSREAFIRAIHPEDRAMVEEHIRRVREGGRFDIEYRILPASGEVRVVRGMGEVVQFGPDSQPRFFGTIQDLTTPRAEVLGVIQDITDRKRLEWKLEQEAHTDPLTGCANRRYFSQLAENEFARTRRYGGELTLLMLDLDCFKAINDRYGHQGGDRILQSLVALCQRTLREEDVIARMGGEEFAVMLPETGSERGLEVAERLRQAVAAFPVELADGKMAHFTISIGVATLAPADDAIGMVLERADSALYAAKRTGRNRVVNQSDPSRRIADTD